MADVWTQKKIDALEKEVALQYKRASKELHTKSEAYFARYEQRLEEYEQLVKDGKKTKAEFKQWKLNNIGRGKRWEALRDTMAQRMADANSVAAALINDRTPSIFALSHNYEAYRIEKYNKDISFTLLPEQAIKSMLMGENHMEFKTVRTNPHRDYAWSRRKIQNALTQGIMQGDGIKGLTERYLDVMGANRAAAVRNARTSSTSAYNAGKQASFERLKEMGVEFQKEWVANLDSRTRNSHQKLDGERVGADETFSNKLLYPCHPSGAPHEVYNCRCRMRAIFPGVNDTHGSRERVYKVDNGEYEDYEWDGSEYKTATGVTYKGGETSISYEDWLAGKRYGDDPLMVAKDEMVSLVNRQADLAKKMAALNKTYSNIWYSDVNVADDWETKSNSGAIQRKEDYFKQKLQEAQMLGNTADVAKFEKLLDDLHEFDRNGKKWADLKKRKDVVDGNIKVKKQDIRILGGYDPMSDPYSQERKDAAIWAQSTKEADDYLRDTCGEVWQNAPEEEKQAIYDYTWTYAPFNEPLRGIEYYSNEEKGVGNTDLVKGFARKGIPKDSGDRMTDIIEKSSYDRDIWLQRGCGFRGMDKFLQIDAHTLQYGSQKELEDDLLGKTITEYGFMSCGVAKGKGFSGDIIFNVYAPSGTKMMYAEPFSQFGEGSGRRWDGKKKQVKFGSESEIILQQGTQFRITKVEKTPRMIYIDIEVIGNLEPQRWRKR